jgi:hypothetical protein
VSTLLIEVEEIEIYANYGVFYIRKKKMFSNDDYLSGQWTWALEIFVALIHSKRPVDRSIQTITVIIIIE